MTKYVKDEIVTGCVTGIEKYGIFVNLDEYYSGLIHISEISSGFVKNVSDFVNVGETIRVKIIGIKDDSYQLKLSIKDIDYRITKRRRNKIVETPTGFTPLKEHLNTWIDTKYNEIINKK